MASLFERVQNVFDNHQDFDRQRERQEGRKQGLHETRDAMLGSALSLKGEWSQELANTKPESQAAIHARYEARVQGLNDAFAALKQAEPGITTQLSPDEFRESASRQAHPRSQEAPGLSQSPYHFAYAVTRQQLDTDLAQRSTPEAKEQLIQEVTRSANYHLATAYPSEDRAAGIRQAKVDWALQHEDGRNTMGGGNLPILRPDQYEAGYDARKESLDRKLESWRTSPVIEHSKDQERQAVREMAVDASRSVRENWGDRGRGPERLEDRDYDRGQRKAIMDWSHEHNHRLAVEQSRAMEQESTREVHEYGMSY